MPQSLNPRSNPMRQLLLLFPFYAGAEVIRLGRGKAGLHFGRILFGRHQGKALGTEELTGPIRVRPLGAGAWSLGTCQLLVLSITSSRQPPLMPLPLQAALVYRCFYLPDASTLLDFSYSLQWPQDADWPRVVNKCW